MEIKDLLKSFIVGDVPVIKRDNCFFIELTESIFILPGKKESMMIAEVSWGSSAALSLSLPSRMRPMFFPFGLDRLLVNFASFASFEISEVKDLQDCLFALLMEYLRSLWLTL